MLRLEHPIRPALLAFAVVLTACGNSGSQQPQQNRPVVVTPPTPPPQPQPPPPPPPPTPGPKVADVAPGGRLSGPLACAAGTLTFSSEADGGGRLTDVSGLTQVKLEENQQGIAYLAADTYQTDVNGFGGPMFAPADKRPGPSHAYDYFRDGRDEFELYRNATPETLAYVTLGRVSNDGGVCFFTSGAPTSNFLVDGAYDYSGIADGLLVRSDGGTERLFGSQVTIRLDAGRREMLATISLHRRATPFGEFLDSPTVSMGEATARLSYAGPRLAIATVSGPDGSTGTMTGEFHDRLVSMSFVFELRYPNGDRIFGAAAAEFAGDSGF